MTTTDAVRWVKECWGGQGASAVTMGGDYDHDTVYNILHLSNCTIVFDNCFITFGSLVGALLIPMLGLETYCTSYLV